MIPLLNSRKESIIYVCCMAFMISLICVVCVSAAESDRIQPYVENPYYWQYKGEPVLLLGGSKEDNLFNHPDGLEEHLDLLVACGGNYVRNTMGSYDEGNPYGFHLNQETGLYDLNKMGEELWERFSNFLKMTAERDIIVQIEVFDRFDYAQENWQKNPFNPKNNINYTVEESGLPEVINSHPAHRENPFFRSVPNLENNTLLLPWQEAFVSEMLSYSLQYGHVLYCISNETNESEEWGAYWANYIRSAASDAGVEVHITEMWDNWDLTHPEHNSTFDHPELYTFIDISQNNHISGQAHWDNTQYIRNRIKENPRPINNIKMYGGVTHGGSLEEGLRRMWRNALGGMASARFHRPGPRGDVDPLWGAGLGIKAQAYIRSTRYLMNEMGWPNIEPTLSFVSISTDQANQVRSENGIPALQPHLHEDASIAAIKSPDGARAAIFVSHGACLEVDTSQLKEGLQTQWFDPRNIAWLEAVPTEKGYFQPPSTEDWLLVLR